MKKWLTVSFFLFFIGACAMPETKIYSLYLMMDPEKATYPKGGDASLAIIINSPRYLTQPYIVYRKSPYQLDISRYSKWDVSPNERLREVFKEALSSIPPFKEVRAMNIVPEGFYSLKINLKKFERSDMGNDSFSELVFDVHFISPDGKELFQDSIAKKSKMDDRTFLNLAKGLSGVLQEGVDEVRDNIARHFK
ncbi:MAG: hypothetical protein A2169_12865 [Deltaproteobacteria bacterium RBG_13_47_9]|nr:MAG: hypothetical protein A2169_12865 [Deltaproteobacteria bacterium RBG_13_47_9]